MKERPAEATEERTLISPRANRSSLDDEERIRELEAEVSRLRVEGERLKARADLTTILRRHLAIRLRGPVVDNPWNKGYRAALEYAISLIDVPPKETGEEAG